MLLQDALDPELFLEPRDRGLAEGPPGAWVHVEAGPQDAFELSERLFVEDYRLQVAGMDKHIRASKWLVARGSYPNLRRATVPSFMQWVPVTLPSLISNLVAILGSIGGRAGAQQVRNFSRLSVSSSA